MAPRDREAVRSERAPSPVGPYSQAVVRDGRIYLSGQIPLDPASGALVEGDIEAQTERVLQNLQAVLEAADSGLADVVRTTIYLTDLANFGRVNAVYARFFDSEPAPARSTVQVAALPLGAEVEIDAVAERSA
jgi:2-iminobutanoate/2-iminopropanoate deaminase